MRVHIDELPDLRGCRGQSCIEPSVSCSHWTGVDIKEGTPVVPERRVVDRGHKNGADRERFEESLELARELRRVGQDASGHAPEEIVAADAQEGQRWPSDVQTAELVLQIGHSGPVPCSMLQTGWRERLQVLASELGEA
jgi:hypothetical protein